MAAEDTKQEKKTVTQELDRKDSRGKVADYLQGPRKKRRSYVITALSAATNHIFQGIDAFVKGQYKNTLVAQPKNIEELIRNFNRQVVLLIIDDEFGKLEDCLHIVGELKRKKSPTVVPTLFLTRKPQILVTEYHKMLLPFHESDDLIDWNRAEIRHIYAKIRNGLGQQFARRSRRYKIDIPVRYSVISEETMHQGRLLDLSMHGALLKSEDQQIFRASEQIKISIPTLGLIPTYREEFLRLSCRVRRVFVAGNQVGVSFEYLTDKSSVYLLTFLTNLVLKQSAFKGKTPLIDPKGNFV
jgi:hypothetical protein